MCFIKSSTPKIETPKVEEAVVRHQADASLTKKSKDIQGNFDNENKTAPQGLEEIAPVQRKTLLGD